MTTYTFITAAEAQRRLGDTHQHHASQRSAVLAVLKLELMASVNEAIHNFSQNHEKHFPMIYMMPEAYLKKLREWSFGEDEFWDILAALRQAGWDVQPTTENWIFITTRSWHRVVFTPLPLPARNAVAKPRSHRQRRRRPAKAVVAA